jgi:hypothetical protein
VEHVQLRGKEQAVEDDYMSKHKRRPIALKDAVPAPPTPEEKATVSKTALN